MDLLIPIISQIQETLVSASIDYDWIDLPQIAVVGAQSVGKSSVIEALVKKEFLPRGNGLITKRPIMIQLIHTNENIEYAEFAHKPGTLYSDLIGVKEEIEQEFENTDGKNAISSEIIFLKIFSPKVINLTLIDLPGMIKVPIGDQPSDIEFQVRNIILNFISKSNCIILAITAASTDIANSDSLKIAREVDPLGTRTIGVITKCDTLENGFDALDSLLGKIYPLKLGYVGVVCRNQSQKIEKKSIEDSLKDEETFFSTHPSYSLIKGGCGIPCLTQTLTRILVRTIIDTIPELKTHFKNFLFSTENDIKNYEEPYGAEENQGALLLNFFDRFSRYFQDAVEGKLTCQSTVQLSGGARLNYIFHDWYSKVLDEFQPLSGLSDLEIRTTIRNAAGPKASLFVPDIAFEILVKRQILLLEAPSLKCVEQVYHELKEIVKNCDLPEMKRFLYLRENIFKVVNSVLDRLLGPTNKMIKNIIQMQTAYINTNHPEFVKIATKLINATDFENLGFNSSPQVNNENISLNSDIRWKNKVFKQSEIQSNESIKNGYSVNTNDKIKATANGIFNFFLKEKPFKDNYSSSPSSSLDINFMCKNSHQDEDSIFKTYQAEESKRYNMGITLPSIPSKIVPNDPPSDREILESKLTRSLIHTYFSIVRQSVADSVPKAIMYFMVNSAKEIIPRHLVTILYKDSLFSDLLKESQVTIQNRTKLKELRSKIKKALETLNGIPDLCSAQIGTF